MSTRVTCGAILLLLANCRFEDFCERHLIGWTRHSFINTATPYIEREIDRLEIQSRWRKLTIEESMRLDIMRTEIELRRLDYAPH